MIINKLRNKLRNIILYLIGIIGTIFFIYKKGKKDQKIIEEKKDNETLIKEYQENEKIKKDISNKSIDDKFDFLYKDREN